MISTIMSEFSKEVIKMAIDKGLLGGIAALLAYYGSRLLERYKAHNLYQQQLSARRLQAYEGLSEHLYGMLKQTKNMFDTIRDGRSAGNLNTEESINEVNKSWADLITSMEAAEVRLSKNLIFISPKSGQSVLDFCKGVSSFLDTVRRPTEHASPFDHLDATMKQIKKSHDALQNQLLNEVNCGPFLKN